MNKTRAVEVKIHAVSPLFTSANAGKEVKHKKTIRDSFLNSAETYNLKFIFINTPQNSITFKLLWKKFQNNAYLLSLFNYICLIFNQKNKIEVGYILN